MKYKKTKDTGNILRNKKMKEVNQVKKLVINIFLILTVFIIYFLQSNFFTWFNIAGIMPNLFVVIVLFIGLFASKTMGTIYGIVIGLILDLLFGMSVGIQAVSLGLIGFLAAAFDKNFSKDSRMTIMLMVLGSTVIVEVLNYLFTYMFEEINVEIFSFVKILVLEVIFNLLLTIILYPLIRKFGYEIENEYKGNKILTRYF